MGKPDSVKRAQAKGGGRKSSARGQAYGSKRGVPNKQVHRTEVRYEKPRVQQSMAEAKAVQAALEAQMAAEAKEPALGPTEGAVYVAEQRARAEREEAERQAALERREAGIRAGHRFEPWEGEGRGVWTIGMARKMLMEGYCITQVMKMSGVGYRWLSDIRLDADNRGIADAG